MNLTNDHRRVLAEVISEPGVQGPAISHETGINQNRVYVLLNQLRTNGYIQRPEIGVRGFHPAAAAFELFGVLFPNGAPCERTGCAILAPTGSPICRSCEAVDEELYKRIGMRRYQWVAK